MRDQTRKVMKARLDVLKDQGDRITAQINDLQGQRANLNALISGLQQQRTDLKTEADLIKADLDADPETQPA